MRLKDQVMDLECVCVSVMLTWLLLGIWRVISTLMTRAPGLSSANSHSVVHAWYTLMREREKERQREREGEEVNGRERNWSSLRKERVRQIDGSVIKLMNRSRGGEIGRGRWLRESVVCCFVISDCVL